MTPPLGKSPHPTLVHLSAQCLAQEPLTTHKDHSTDWNLMLHCLSVMTTTPASACQVQGRHHPPAMVTLKLVPHLPSPHRCHPLSPLSTEAVGPPTPAAETPMPHMRMNDSTLHQSHHPLTAFHPPLSTKSAAWSRLSMWSTSMNPVPVTAVQAETPMPPCLGRSHH